MTFVISYRAGVMFDRLTLKLGLRKQTVQDRIAAAIRRWPTLYGCRTDVLHQWLCVNGNGMEWVNGELVDCYEDHGRDKSVYEDEEAEILRFGYLKYETREGRNKASARLRARVRRRNAECRFRIKNAHILAYEEWTNLSIDGIITGPSPRPIYPLWEDSLLCQVPDDVKPEWLALVSEMIFVVFRAPKRKSGGRWTQEYVDAEYHRTLEFASKALTDLSGRFGWKGPKSYEEWRERQNIANKDLFEMLNGVLAETEAEDGKPIEDSGNASEGNSSKD